MTTTNPTTTATRPPSPALMKRRSRNARIAASAGGAELGAILRDAAALQERIATWMDQHGTGEGCICDACCEMRDRGEITDQLEWLRLSLDMGAGIVAGIVPTDVYMQK
jgi:hypothetical protein